MEEKLQEDWLDARLRDEAPYIDDGGFTSRVVHKLPVRQVRRSYRAFIMLGITLRLHRCLLAGRRNLSGFRRLHERGNASSDVDVDLCGRNGDPRHGRRSGRGAFTLSRALKVGSQTIPAPAGRPRRSALSALQYPRTFVPA
jgi:hypothetical protein